MEFSVGWRSNLVDIVPDLDDERPVIAPDGPARSGLQLDPPDARCGFPVHEHTVQMVRAREAAEAEERRLRLLTLLEFP